jgi:hypothetical protein
MSAFSNVYAVLRPRFYSLFRRVRNWPALANRLRAIDRRLRLGATKEEVFGRIYRDNLWDNDESRSGRGSTLAYTESIRSALPEILRKYNVKIFLDAPSGDFNWMAAVPMHGVRYVGADIVPQLVQRNQERYAGNGRLFVRLDLTRDPLPQADLWMCRDCIIHLSNADVWRLLDNFVRSGIPHILLSSYPETVTNEDTYTGGFHPINLCAAPFLFPPPILAVPDFVDGFPRRELAMWSREGIRPLIEGRANKE